jgi:TolA-binding protein
MNPKLKLTAYAVLIIMSALFAHGFYSNYILVTKPEADIGSTGPAAMADDGAKANSDGATNPNTVANTASATDTNASSTMDPNTIAATDANVEASTNAESTPGTSVTAVGDTNKSSGIANARKHKRKAAKAAAPPPDAAAARGSLITYLAAFVGSMIGLGLLVAYDVTQFAGTQAVDFLFNDAGEGQRDPEYERAEQAWANGKHLEAIQLMRDFLKKNPREIYAALRIAEIYEKDLKNPLASALEYEEVLKQKLPPERWGWAAIHLCNLYSKLNKTDQALALLQRIADEYPKTAAAKKARVRLGLAEPEPGMIEEEVVAADSESSEGSQVITMEERPPELEPRTPSAFRSPAEPAPADVPETPKPSLPPGFRKKK